MVLGVLQLQQLLSFGHATSIIYIIYRNQRRLSLFELNKILSPCFGGFTIFHININSLLILTNHNYISLYQNNTIIYQIDDELMNHHYF